jgi:hypothetical protein
MREPIHQLLAGKFADGVLWKGHKIEVYKICGNYRVFCDGNLFAVEVFSDPDHAINDAIRKIKYIEGLRNG